MKSNNDNIDRIRGTVVCTNCGQVILIGPTALSFMSDECLEDYKCTACSVDEDWYCEEDFID